MSIEQLKNDFSDFDNIISDCNHVVRRFYRCYVNGDYGEDVYTKLQARWLDVNTDKQARMFVIQSFVEYNALDYSLSTQQVQRWLVNNIGHDKLEQLNQQLINDVRELQAEAAA